jgi:nicotinic acid phosphoribosyltransferase
MVPGSLPLRPLMAASPQFGGDPEKLENPHAAKSAWVRRFFAQVLAPRLQRLVDTLNHKAGFPMPIRVPLPLETDTYTFFGEWVVSQASKDQSVYHITARRTPKWVKESWMQETLKAMGQTEKDFRFVFYGAQNLIGEVLGKPYTYADHAETEKLAAKAKRGNALLWAQDTWKRVLDENNGVLPVKVEAPREGSVFFPGEPIIKITAKDGFGDLANHLENKLLQVGRQSELATAAMYWLEYNKQLVRRCQGADEQLSEEQITTLAAMQTANFSDRSATSPQDSLWLGKAFGLAHPICSTMSSIYHAWKESGEEHGLLPAMYSLAHRIVQSYPQESAAYQALYDIAKDEHGSYVSDCYDAKRALYEYLLPKAKEIKEKGGKGVICVRPDSGDAFDQITTALNAAVQEGLYTEVTTQDGRTLKRMTTLKVIEADGVNFEFVKNLNDRLLAAGFSPPHCVIYGIGGALVKLPSRDNISLAQKIASVGAGAEAKPVAKLPLEKDDAGKPILSGDRNPIGKWSIPIPAEDIKLSRDGEAPSVRAKNEPGEDLYVTYFDGTRLGEAPYFRREAYTAVRKRANDGSFIQAKAPKRVMSDTIFQHQLRILAEQHGEDVARQVIDELYGTGAAGISEVA